MGSTRLPGKVLKKINQKTILEHVIERVKKAKLIDQIIIATTNLEEDDVISKHISNLGITVFRGSELNVLSRYYNAAKENKADIVIRITSDCPLIDSKIIDKCIQKYIDNDCDILTNAGGQNRTFPRGLDTEVFSFEKLEYAYKNAKKNYEKEHVTTFIYSNANKIYYYKNEKDLSKIRVTVDTQEDFDLIKIIYNFFGDKEFYLDDLERLFASNPNLYTINSEITQKDGCWENVYR